MSFGYFVNGSDVWPLSLQFHIWFPGQVSLVAGLFRFGTSGSHQHVTLPLFVFWFWGPHVTAPNSSPPLWFMVGCQRNEQAKAGRPDTLLISGGIYFCEEAGLQQASWRSSRSQWVGPLLQCTSSWLPSPHLTCPRCLLLHPGSPLKHSLCLYYLLPGSCSFHTTPENYVYPLPLPESISFPPPIPTKDSSHKKTESRNSSSVYCRWEWLMGRNVLMSQFEATVRCDCITCAQFSGTESHRAGLVVPLWCL